MKKASYSIFAALVLILSACVQSTPHVGKYASVVTVYQNGKVIKAVVLEVTDSVAKCETDIKVAAEALGAPPAGITAELSCVELVPFQTLTAESAVATPHSTLPGPKTDSI